MSDEEKYAVSDEIDWSEQDENKGGKHDTGEQEENPGHEKTEDTDTEKREDSAGELNPKKRGLGRGLDALFGEEEEPEHSFDEPDTPSSPTESETNKTAEDPEYRGTERKILGIDQLEPNPDQPRRKFDESSLAELAASISRYGLLQPILVRPKSGETGEGDNYEIIAGERRWRACQLAKIHSVPVIIHDLGDEETLELALIENLQREDLNPIDEALGYQKLMDDFAKTQDALSEVVGKSRSHIANILRLISLPESVQAMVRDGELTAGHARTLVKAENPEEIAKKIVEGQLSVRQAEALALESGATTARSDKPKSPAPSSGQGGASQSASPPSKPKKDVDTLALEEEVSNMLGMKVDIQMQGRNGRLGIEFDDLDQLDDLLHRLTHGGPKQGFDYSIL